MEPENEDMRLNWAISAALDSGNITDARRLFNQNPHKKHDREYLERRLMSCAGREHIHVVEMLLDEFGLDVNTTSGIEKSTPLGNAIYGNQLEMMRFLLARGADPDIGRPIISAINRKNRHPEEYALEFVKLLVEHGCDVNQQFVFMGEKGHLFTALDWAGEDSLIGKYLRRHGAKTIEELRRESGQPVTSRTTKKKKASATPAETVTAYFTKHFGPVAKQSFIEIVPVDPAIVVHVVPPSAGRQPLTLFTTGMSEEPMTVPDGQETWRYGELFIQLPGDWKYRDIGNREWDWPVHWLRRIAKYPHQQDTWLGDGVTVIDSNDPPERLAPNVRFTSFLLMAEKDVSTSDGRLIQLYRLTPLYPEERALERREGIAALLQAFDREDVPFIVDPNRKNVAL